MREGNYMGSKVMSRELPAFEIHGTEEFYIYRNFFLTTGVLALKVEQGESGSENVIVFYVLNNDDKVKALGSLRKLYHVFIEYRYVIIRKYDEFDIFHNFFMVTAVLALKVEQGKTKDGNTIIFYVLNRDDDKVHDNLSGLYRTFRGYNRIIIRKYGG